MDSFHKCRNMPTGYSIEDNFIVVRGLDGSWERAEKPCKFCPFCGVELDMEPQKRTRYSQEQKEG